MRFALNLPNFGPFADPHLMVDLAVESEVHGWDGFFLWDHILIADAEAVADPWVVLAAIASATTRIRIGPMVTPLARRRPWKVAREAVTLDHLSGGRVVFGAGLGNPPDCEFEAFGEDPNDRSRAEKLDEGLRILTGMWSGEPFNHHGKHYELERHRFLPLPVQRPRIPIWIAGKWPNRAPFRRAARWDGVFPMKVGDEPLTVREVEEIVQYVSQHRDGNEEFDVSIFVRGFLTNPANQSEVAKQFAEGGVTWIHDGPNPDDLSVDSLRRCIREGPPQP